MICPECMGYRQIDDCEADKSDRPEARQFTTCPTCGGSGEVTDVEHEAYKMRCEAQCHFKRERIQ